MPNDIDNERPLDEHDALRADIYRLLARLVWAAPDDALLAFLGGLEGEPDSGPLAEHWTALARAAREGKPDALARAHFRHLVGVIEGEVNPFASWYLHGTLMDEPLVAIRADLRRLNLERQHGNSDPEDHFAALCDAMAWLVEVRPRDQSSFFMRHLAPWGERCMADLACVDTPFYACLGELARAFLHLERERLEAEQHQSSIRIIDPTPG